jgi:hypothetical protein
MQQTSQFLAIAATASTVAATTASSVSATTKSQGNQSKIKKTPS